MADSLRDQLIAAGYEAPKKEQKRKPRPQDHAKGKNKPNRKGKKSTAHKRPGQSTGQSPNRSAGNKTGQRQADNQSAEALKAIEERKKLKAQIKELIDSSKIENWKGDVVYRYLVDKRIRELYVTEELHKRLADRTVSVTRLNGDTYLVPLDTAKKIKEINPQWSVFNTEDEDTTTNATEESDYADYQIPDDLKW